MYLRVSGMDGRWRQEKDDLKKSKFFFEYDYQILSRYIIKSVSFFYIFGISTLSEATVSCQMKYIDRKADDKEHYIPCIPILEGRNHQHSHAQFQILSK